MALSKEQIKELKELVEITALSNNSEKMKG
jgi:hypothetical protein